MRIIVKNNDPLRAFKLLNRKLHEDNTFIELKERQHYKSKGEKKREKRKRAIARQRKEDAKRLEKLQKIENQIMRGPNDRRNQKRRAS